MTSLPKILLWAGIYVGIFGTATVVAVSCETETSARQQLLEQKEVQGRLTPEEQIELGKLHSQRPGPIDWSATIASVIAAAGATFLGLRRAHGTASSLTRDVHSRVDLLQTQIDSLADGIEMVRRDKTNPG